MKVYEVPLTFAKHIDILGKDIRRAFTGPSVLCFLFVLVLLPIKIISLLLSKVIWVKAGTTREKPPTSKTWLVSHVP